MEDQHLAIALRSRANADCRNGNLGCNHGRHFTRHSFEHQGEYSRPVERNRVLHQPFNASQVFALDSVAAHLVDRLWSQPDVPHHRYFRIQHALDQFDALRAALQLYCLGARLFHKAYGVVNTLLDLPVIRAKWHIGDHQC